MGRCSAAGEPSSLEGLPAGASGGYGNGLFVSVSSGCEGGLTALLFLPAFLLSLWLTFLAPRAAALDAGLAAGCGAAGATAATEVAWTAELCVRGTGLLRMSVSIM